MGLGLTRAKHIERVLGSSPSVRDDRIYPSGFIGSDSSWMGGLQDPSPGVRTGRALRRDRTSGHASRYGLHTFS